ncbi:MAG: hypothetical protein AAGH64_02900 [Planctomycetota bacterium]
MLDDLGQRTRVRFKHNDPRADPTLRRAHASRACLRIGAIIAVCSVALAIPLSHTIKSTTIVSSIFALLGWTLLFFWFRRRRTRLPSIAKTRGLCQSCLEDLSVITPDAYGRTRCPGCAATWRLKPASRPLSVEELRRRLDRNTIIDDRGREIAFAYAFSALFGDRDLLKRSSVEWVHLLTAWPIALFSFCAFSSVFSGWYLVAVLWAIIAIPTYVIVHRTRANIWRPRVSVVANSDRRCVACLYHLGPLIPEPDGCTVCPECSAAWRLADTDDA